MNKINGDLFKVDEMYDELLRKNNILQKKARILKSEGRYSASSSGMCIKKQWFEKQGYTPTSPNSDSLRIFRLGTIVGEDIDKAVK